MPVPSPLPPRPDAPTSAPAGRPAAGPIGRRPNAASGSIARRIIVLGVAALAAFTAFRAWDKQRRAPAADDPEVEFTVDGLDCPVWCAVRLGESIDGLDGARVERLDQRTGRVVVRHDPGRQGIEGLREVFEASGFHVRAIARPPAATAATEPADQLRR